VYYIKGISHDFNVGDGITTTLTLVGARRIVRGFLAKKKVTQFYKVLQPDGTFTMSKNAPNAKGAAKNIREASFESNSTEIMYYVPLNATNFTDLPFSPNPQQNDAINKQLNVDNDSQYAATISEGHVRILTSVYTITSHPNPVMIGLIVDQDSAVLAQINQNYYKFLTNLPNYAKTQFESKYKELGIANPKLIVPAASAIEKEFLVFTGLSQGPQNPSTFEKTHGFSQASVINLKGPNAGSKFTYNQLNFFLVSQYKRIAAQVDDKVIVKTPSKYEDLDVQRSILDLLLKDIDAFGSYIQYTDEYGRELPSYIDFGKSMTIYQTDVALSNTKEAIDAAKALKAKNDAKAKRAASIAASGPPNPPPPKPINGAFQNITPTGGDILPTRQQLNDASTQIPLQGLVVAPAPGTQVPAKRTGPQLLP
jgi:hypothetical protein